MTAANINFAVPTANALPALSASQPASASVQNGDQSFSQVLQTRENASSPNQSSQSAPAASKEASANDSGKPSSDAKDTSDAKSAKDQQSADTPQETAQKAAQVPQTGLPKPAIKVGAGSTGLTTDTGTTETDATQTTQPDAGLLAAMAAANLAAQPASPAGKTLPVDVTATAAGPQADQAGLFLDSQAEDAGAMKDLFQLAASADAAGKPDTAAAGGRGTTDFSAALNTAIDTQGGNAVTANPLAPPLGTPATQQTETTSRQVVSTPVATQGWAEEVGHKVSWAAGNGNGRAELILTPAHMGRIEVSINMNGDQASANFVAANAATREALQDAMPQLREVLAGAGIQLGQANVSANSGGQAWSGGSGQSGFDGRSYSAGGDGAADTSVDALTSRSRGAWVLSGNGLVDTFA